MFVSTLRTEQSLTKSEAPGRKLSAAPRLISRARLRRDRRSPLNYRGIGSVAHIFRELAVEPGWGIAAEDSTAAELRSCAAGGKSWEAIEGRDWAHSQRGRVLADSTRTSCGPVAGSRREQSCEFEAGAIPQRRHSYVPAVDLSVALRDPERLQFEGRILLGACLGTRARRISEQGTRHVLSSRRG